MERQIIMAIREEVYAQAMDLIPGHTLQNAIEDVVSALRAGKISHSRGQFRGRFSSAVSRELKKIGAVWDRKQGSWKAPLSALPTDIRTAIAASEQRFLATAAKIDERLSQILPEQVAERAKIGHLFDTSIHRLDGSIRKTMKGLVVSPDITADERRRIAREYTENMKLKIKDWADYEIKQLRKTIKESTFAGNRYEGLVEDIQRRYAVTQQKAKFLARQENNILMSKFKEVRYASAGIKKYRWRSVAGTKAHPVRKMHKKLDGSIQRFDTPPVVDNKGSRKNPGEDYGCRCTAIPIVEF